MNEKITVTPGVVTAMNCKDWKTCEGYQDLIKQHRELVKRYQELHKRYEPAMRPWEQRTGRAPGLAGIYDQPTGQAARMWSKHLWDELFPPFALAKFAPPERFSRISKRGYLIRRIPARPKLRKPKWWDSIEDRRGALRTLKIRIDNFVKEEGL